MNEMNVYRIENQFGSGFYHGSFLTYFQPVQFWWVDETKNMCNTELTEFILDKHPHIPIDMRDHVYSDNTLVFGCQSAKLLLDWFPEHILHEVNQHDGTIKEYTIHKKYVNFYDKQCVFDISKILNKKELSSNELIKMVKHNEYNY